MYLINCGLGTMFQINDIEAKYTEPCGKSVWNNRPTNFTRLLPNNETHHFMYNFFFRSFLDIPNSKSVSNESQIAVYSTRSTRNST